MTIDEVILRERTISEDNKRVVDTNILYDDVTIDEFYADDTEVIEEHLNNYRKCADYHRHIAEWLEELKRYRDTETAYEQGGKDAVKFFAEKLENKFKFGKHIDAVLNSNNFPIIKETYVPDVIKNVLEEMFS